MIKLCSLSQRAMLVRLSISKWTARKYDKTASNTVATAFNTNIDVGRYNKLLVQAKAIQPVTQAESDVRRFHYENTLPWSNDNARLLPSANFTNYSQEMRVKRQLFETAAAEFVAKYSQYVTEAKVRLNGMFNQNDYPEVSRIAGYFGMDVDISPLPDADDFRVALQDSDVNEIKKDIEERSRQAQETAMSDLWTRLHGVVQNMSERLSVKDGVFRDSLVGNISELCALLPRLNIANDPNLELMRQQVEQKLCGYTPKELRKDSSARMQAAMDAEAILTDMTAMIGSK